MAGFCGKDNELSNYMKSRNFMASVLSTWRLIMWALLSVCMFQNIFYAEDNFLLENCGVELGR
jgi:hypothetical protein